MRLGALSLWQGEREAETLDKVDRLMSTMMPDGGYRLVPRSEAGRLLPTRLSRATARCRPTLLRGPKSSNARSVRCWSSVHAAAAEIGATVKREVVGATDGEAMKRPSTKDAALDPGGKAAVLAPWIAVHRDLRRPTYLRAAHPLATKAIEAAGVGVDRRRVLGVVGDGPKASFRRTALGLDIRCRSDAGTRRASGLTGFAITRRECRDRNPITGRRSDRPRLPLVLLWACSGRHRVTTTPTTATASSQRAARFTAEPPTSRPGRSPRRRGRLGIGGPPPPSPPGPQPQPRWRPVTRRRR